MVTGVGSSNLCCRSRSVSLCLSRSVCLSLSRYVCIGLSVCLFLSGRTRANTPTMSIMQCPLGCIASIVNVYFRSRSSDFHLQKASKGNQKHNFPKMKGPRPSPELKLIIGSYTMPAAESGRCLEADASDLRNIVVSFCFTSRSTRLGNSNVSMVPVLICG